MFANVIWNLKFRLNFRFQMNVSNCISSGEKPPCGAWSAQRAHGRLACARKPVARAFDRVQACGQEPQRRSAGGAWRADSASDLASVGLSSRMAACPLAVAARAGG
jgi:hypothetical protein